jgi:hypothetical protein
LLKIFGTRRSKMADQNRREEQAGDRGGTSTKGKEQTGDPGRTPGTAEGDRQTVEEDIRNKEREGKV